jgi:hypothetical protein
MFKALRAFVDTMPSKTEMSIPAMALLDLVQYTINLQARCDYMADVAMKYQRNLKTSEIMMRDACPKLCASHELFLAAFKAAELETNKVKLHEYAATEPSDMDLNHWIACALAGLAPSQPSPNSKATSISRSESTKHLYTSPRITPELAQEINGSLRALDLQESGQEVNGSRGNWKLPKRASPLLEYAPGLEIGYDFSCDKHSVVSSLDGDKNVASQHSYSGCGSYLKDLKDFVKPGNHCNEANPEDIYQFSSSKGILNGPGFEPVVASVQYQATDLPETGGQQGIETKRITLRTVDHHENPHLPAEAPRHREFYAFRNERYASNAYYPPPPSHALSTVSLDPEDCFSVISDDRWYQRQRAMTETPPASCAPSEYEESVVPLTSRRQSVFC